MRFQRRGKSWHAYVASTLCGVGSSALLDERGFQCRSIRARAVSFILQFPPLRNLVEDGSIQLLNVLLGEAKNVRLSLTGVVQGKRSSRSAKRFLERQAYCLEWLSRSLAQKL